MRKIYFVLLAIAGFSTGLTGCFDNPYQYYGQSCAQNEDCVSSSLSCVNGICVGRECSQDDDCDERMTCDQNTERCVLSEPSDPVKDAGQVDAAIGDTFSEELDAAVGDAALADATTLQCDLICSDSVILFVRTV